MKTIQVIEQSKEIEKEKEKLKEKLKKLNSQLSILGEECPHEIVFKYNDNQPRKMVIDGNYYCPACSKNIEFIFKNQYLTSCFKDSKIISLTDISLVGDTKTLLKIKEEVLNNMDFYYKCNDLIEIRNRMEHKLKDYVYDYSKKNKILKLTKK